jgi:hypothetical protein
LQVQPASETVLDRKEIDLPKIANDLNREKSDGSSWKRSMRDHIAFRADGKNALGDVEAIASLLGENSAVRAAAFSTELAGSRSLEQRWITWPCSRLVGQVAFSRYEARKPLRAESVVSDEFAATLRFIFVAGGHMMLQQSIQRASTDIAYGGHFKLQSAGSWSNDTVARSSLSLTEELLPVLSRRLTPSVKTR